MELFGYLEAAAHQSADQPQPAAHISPPKDSSLPAPVDQQPKVAEVDFAPEESDFDLESWRKGSLTATCWV